eukprot:758443-Hanusia_phi.AAC.2
MKNPRDGTGRKELKYSVFNFSEKSVASPELDESDSIKNLLFETFDPKCSTSDSIEAMQSDTADPASTSPSLAFGNISIFGSEAHMQGKEVKPNPAAAFTDSRDDAAVKASGEPSEKGARTAKQIHADDRLALKKHILLSSANFSFDPIINLDDMPANGKDSNMRWDAYPRQASMYNTGISVNVRMSDKQV